MRTAESSGSKRLGKLSRKAEHTSTVGRGKAIVLDSLPTVKDWSDGMVSVHFGDSLELYSRWAAPAVIVSDGGYGVLGFEGDTSDHLGLPEWYEPHVRAWSRFATPQTTLWFWNSEIGWAAVHPILEQYGWRYQNCNIWNKGLAHIAGNVNTTKIRRFPVVTEVCVQYVLEARLEEKPLKVWLLDEWKRTKLSLREANTACGVADAAVRKYLDQGHLWYFPPPEMFEKLQKYANEHGDPAGRPYYCIYRGRPGTADEWSKLRSHFTCPHGVTNVWDRPPVNGAERIKSPSGRAVHLNQKPLDLMARIIEASSRRNEVVWEPFGGLFSASVAARQVGRKAIAAEIDPTYFQYGLARLKEEHPGLPNL